MKNVEPHFFPVKHLSPSGAWHLRKYLEEIDPDIVLIEGPSDVQEELDDLASRDVKPPIAILAYTNEMPVKTILYPLADYSPEYQAVKWAKSHGKEVRFIDLPSEVFLAFEEKREEFEEVKDIEESSFNIYDEVYKADGDIDYDTFWERNFEHNLEKDAYRLSMLTMGKELRAFTEKPDARGARDIVREGYMKYQIQKANEEGYAYDKMVVVTGAYHTSQLRNPDSLALTEKEIEQLPRRTSHLTLMPYSYYRLSNTSGYGAGNKSPYYFEKMWQYMKEENLEHFPEYFMTAVAKSMREEGHITSPAVVIEAVRLAMGLAKLHDGSMPTLQDLRDGAKTCLGEGAFSKVSTALAKVEIGTKIGSLPDGMSRTALQNNFNFMLKDLKLEKYKSVVAEDVTLDLRENRRVKTEKAAYQDLYRSYFLHQLTVLGVSFAQAKDTYQEDANWKEEWVLCWRPETEIELVESALYGDTVEMAAAYVLKEKLDRSTEIKEAVKIIATCYECGMGEMAAYGIKILQSLSVETEAFDQLAQAAFGLSGIIRFGSVRRIESADVEPILSELFLRASLQMVSAANCNYEASKVMGESMEQLNQMAGYHEELVDDETFVTELTMLSNRDDLNARLSGIATSILLERSLIDKEMLTKEISRRMLPGIPADIGAGWFEGLASRNRYVILANITIWEKLDDYIMSLDQEEIKPAIVFLHRTFSTFAANEKYMIAENLANIWGLDQDDLSAYLNEDFTEQEEKVLEDLQDFDFDF